MTTTIYRAEFFTAADYAAREFEAETPDQALELARRFYEEDIGELDFRSYEDNAPLDQIDIWRTEECAHARRLLCRASSWESDEFRLRQTAPQLRAALALVLPHYAEFLRALEPISNNAMLIRLRKLHWRRPSQKKLI
jgi:hypothetical protein